jgi:hypothetical protein
MSVNIQLISPNTRPSSGTILESRPDYTHDFLLSLLARLLGQCKCLLSISPSLCTVYLSTWVHFVPDMFSFHNKFHFISFSAQKEKFKKPKYLHSCLHYTDRVDLCPHVYYPGYGWVYPKVPKVL